jgi:hypothetical protein
MLQKMRWYSGTRRTIRDVGTRCIDLPANRHKMHLKFYRCHGGANQGWYIDRKGFNYPKQPLASGVKFQIRLIQSGGRALFKTTSHLGGG